MTPLSARFIKQEAQRLGFNLCRIIPAGEAPHYDFFMAWLERGCAGEMEYLQQHVEKRGNPARLAPANQEKYHSIVVLAVNYFDNGAQAADNSDPSHGLLARYACGQDYHDIIRPRLHELDAFIARQSGRTRPGKCLVDSGPVLERDWAQLAGIGFIGKNCCVIHPVLGSWLFLATVLVPGEIESDRQEKLSQIRLDPNRIIVGLPAQENFGAWEIPVEIESGASLSSKTGTCGSCHRCLMACPTQAFIGPYFLEPRRCISYWTIEAKGAIPRELRPMFGNRIFGCDVCQDVCPWNCRLERQMPAASGLQARTSPLENSWRGGQSALPLLEGFDSVNPYWLDDKAFTARFAGTPLLRPGRKGMLRNVCVALGNWGSTEALPALAKALEDPEPIVRAHAAWAVGQVIQKRGDVEGITLLKNRLKVETEALVIEEIKAVFSG